MNDNVIGIDWLETAIQVCETSRLMNRHGLAALSSGNVSARVPDSDLVAITPSGVPYEVIQPEDIVIIDLHGNPIQGTLRPSSETPMHILILQEMPEVKAIVHTHSPYAITFSVLREGIPLICNEGLGAGCSRIEVTRFEYPGTLEIGLAAVEMLRSRPGSKAVLLANHGLLTIGASLAEALRIAENVEIEARIYHQARCIGKPVLLTEEQMVEILRRYGRK